MLHMLFIIGLTKQSDCERRTLMKKRLLAVCSLSICMAAFAGCSKEDIMPENAAITEEVSIAEAVTEELTAGATDATTEAATDLTTEVVTEAATETEETSAAKEALCSFMSDPNAYEWHKMFPDEPDYEWDLFMTIELDGDSDPELLATTLDENRVDKGLQPYLIVDYTDNGLVINEMADGTSEAGGATHTLYYVEGKSVIYDIIVCQPYDTPAATTYKIENSKITYDNDGYFEANNDLEYPENIEQGIWHWDGKEVTNEEYDRILNEATYDLSGMAFSGYDFRDKDMIISTLK